MDEEQRHKILATVQHDQNQSGSKKLREQLTDVTARVHRVEKDNQLSVHPMSELLQRLTALMEYEYPGAELYWQRLKLCDLEEAVTHKPAMDARSKLMEGLGDV